MLGDSEARESFRAMNVMMGVKNDYDLKAHEDVAPLPDAGKGVAFYWAPKVRLGGLVQFTRFGLSVYRCLAAGIRQMTTVCERCSEAAYPT